ncbi:hypothetical protein ACP4OV_016490 [Aristida adscensionis]
MAREIDQLVTPEDVEAEERELAETRAEVRDTEMRAIIIDICFGHIEAEDLSFEVLDDLEESLNKIRKLIADRRNAFVTPEPEPEGTVPPPPEPAPSVAAEMGVDDAAAKAPEGGKAN